jgi:hypothetical protein
VKSLEDLNKSEVGNTINASDKNVKALEEKLQALRHKHILSIRDQDALRKQLEEARAETTRMQLLKDDARDFLIACLDDARKQFTVQTGENKDWNPDQPIPWSLQGLSAAGREALLEYLLARLGGTNFGASKSSLNGRSSRQSRARDRGESPHTNGPATASSQVEGSMLPPIGGRNSPVPADAGDSGVFGTWGAKAQLPNSRAQKVYH